MTEPEHIRDILPRVVSRLGGTMSGLDFEAAQDDAHKHGHAFDDAYVGNGTHNHLDEQYQSAISCARKLGLELATAVRAYQAALADPAYWTEPLGQNQQRVSEAFDRMVAMATQILEEDI